MRNYSLLEVGSPSEWSAGEFSHPAFKRPVRGKQFIAEQLGLTSMELSLNCLPPNVAVPFLHSHLEHEELYLFLSGSGEMLVDGETIPVKGGSAVRVAPAGKRAWRNVGNEPLVYLVIQAKAGSLANINIKDGQPCPELPMWT